MKLKICGMKYNTSEVATLQPDYLGFIFYKKSQRNFDGEIPEIDTSIKKVGVFVDEKVETIVSLIEKHQLDAIQLHGHESPEICRLLKSTGKEIIKVFSIKNEFDFNVLEPYEDVADYFLFDTKGKLPGGNGYTFDWSILEQYPSTKSYFLSGGIGLDEVANIKKFKNSYASKYCFALDVNSKFEIEPGLKDILLLREFKYNIQNNDFVAKVTYNGERKGHANSGYRPHLEFEGMEDHKTSGMQLFVTKTGNVYPGESAIAYISILSKEPFLNKLHRGLTFKFFEGSVYIGQGQIVKILNKTLLNKK